MPTPEAKADRLVAALRENTQALRHVRRRYRWSFVLTALLALTLLLVVYTNHQTDIDTCESSNEIRVDIDLKPESIGDFLNGVIPESTEKNDFIELIRSDLPTRNCSDIDWVG